MEKVVVVGVFLVFVLMCALTLERSRAAAWGGEMLCDPTKPTGLWACGCLMEGQGGGWREERLQNRGLNIKNTRLTAPVGHLLLHRARSVCVSVHMCQYSLSHQKRDDSLMRTTIPSVVLARSHSLLCPQKKDVKFSFFGAIL